LIATDFRGASHVKMSPDVLTFLLRGGHLNVDERKAKGLWPNELLSYSEVLDHLAAVIEKEEWFPRVMPKHEPGEFVFEGILIQRINSHRFICHSGSWGKESTRECKSARDAADVYLKQEFNLPGRLDSWIVE
jgi:hypothetical protein